MEREIRIPEGMSVRVTNDLLEIACNVMLAPRFSQGMNLNILREACHAHKLGFRVLPGRSDVDCMKGAQETVGTVHIAFDLASHAMYSALCGTTEQRRALLRALSTVLVSAEPGVEKLKILLRNRRRRIARRAKLAGRRPEQTLTPFKFNMGGDLCRIYSPTTLRYGAFIGIIIDDDVAAMKMGTCGVPQGTEHKPGFLDLVGFLNSRSCRPIIAHRYDDGTTRIYMEPNRLPLKTIEGNIYRYVMDTFKIRCGALQLDPLEIADLLGTEVALRYDAAA